MVTCIIDLSDLDIEFQRLNSVGILNIFTLPESFQHVLNRSKQSINVLE